MMHSYRSHVLNRPDTLFGVCQALGEDLHFNPLILRVALAVPLIWNPLAVVALYSALALVVAVSRLLYPNPQLKLARSIEPEPSAETSSQTLAKAAPVEIRELAVAA